MEADHVIEGKMYARNLETNLFSSSKQLKLKERWILQQDNDLNHEAEGIREQLVQNNGVFAEIEHYWRYLKD